MEQNANQALKLADRGYVLENGRVVLQDTGEALLANPAVRQAYLGGWGCSNHRHLSPAAPPSPAGEQPPPRSTL